MMNDIFLKPLNIMKNSILCRQARYTGKIQFYERYRNPIFARKE